MPSMIREYDFWPNIWESGKEKSNDFSQNCQRIKLSKTERDRPRTSPLELVHLTRSDGLSRDRPRMFAVRLAVPR